MEQTSVNQKISFKTLKCISNPEPLVRRCVKNVFAKKWLYMFHLYIICVEQIVRLSIHQWKHEIKCYLSSLEIANDCQASEHETHFDTVVRNVRWIRLVPSNQAISVLPSLSVSQPCPGWRPYWFSQPQRSNHLIPPATSRSRHHTCTSPHPRTQAMVRNTTVSVQKKRAFFSSVNGFHISAERCM